MDKLYIFNKMIAIVGSTSSGKSELAVQLAKRFKGEIISADSRQIYKGMDLGTGKVEGKWEIVINRGREGLQYFYKEIPHHLIDFINPKKQYSVAEFQKEAKKVIADVTKRGKLPILCGGTAQWIDAVVYNQEIPNIKPNLRLRLKLEKQNAYILFKRLQKLDPTRAKNIDRHNKRRLIRALEIILATGKPIPILKSFNGKALWLGINVDQKTLYKKIDVRLKQRLKAGMIKEVQKLHKVGLSWKKLESFGLEYKFVSQYLQKKLTEDEMFVQLSYAIKHYSKRQMTWWKRNKEIIWLKEPKKAAHVVSKYLK